MADELRACPFCGNGKIKIHEKRRGNYRREGDNYQAWCSRCHARGPLIMDSQAGAAASWNARNG
jgi:Lar family restriction alleviation protein